MQKKIIALAIAAAMTAPALAFAEATVYGTINMDVENYKSDKVSVATTPTSLNRFSNNASNVGVKGSEDLGGGLSAIYQFEAATNNAGGNPAFGGTRNSNLGLKGDWGTLFAGNWDTPYKVTHNPVELFGNTTIFTATNLVGVTNAVSTNWNTRQGSVVQYWSPNMSGFGVKLSYSLDAGKTTTTNKSNLSLNATYDNEMLYAGFAYETRPDQTAAGTNDKAMRLTGEYKLPEKMGMVGLTYEKLTVATSAAPGAATGDQTNYELVGSWNVTANDSVGLSYAKNGEFNSVADTGASQISLRYGHSLSKSTQLYAAYSTLSNDPLATYGSYTNEAAGAKVDGLGVGMILAF
jgi:predicted porin